MKDVVYRMGGVFLLLFLMLQLTSCVALAPILKTYSEIGVSKDDRIQLLEPRVNDFHDAVYWGKSYRALSLAKDESRNDVQNHIRAIRKNKQKVVESNIEHVDFDEDAYEAQVEVVVKYYQEPFYVVQDRTETQKWEFETAVGWKFVSREEVDTKHAG